MTDKKSTLCTTSTSSKNRGRSCVSYKDSSIFTGNREHINEAYLQELRSMGEGIEENLVEGIRIADK